MSTTPSTTAKTTQYTGHVIDGALITADAIPLYEHDPKLRAWAAWVYPPTHVAGASAVLSGAQTENQSVAEAPTAHTGTALSAFVADYYHRVHILPASLDLGNVSGAVNRTIGVWNTHFVDNRLSSIGQQNAEGLRLTPPKPAPTVYGPLEYRIHDLRIFENGPPQQAAEYAFNFATEVRRLVVSLRRILLFDFGPNWTRPVIERLEWLTDVMNARANVEQRVRLRAQPRRSYEYRILTRDNHERIRLHNRLLAWQSRNYALPVWPDATILTQPLAAGVSQIPIATSGRDYTANHMAVLMHGPKSEIMEIQALTADGLTIKKPTRSAWPIGARIAPVCVANINNPLSLAGITDSIARLRPRFDLQDSPALTPASPVMTYRQYPVLTTRPNWQGAISERYARKLIETDFQVGKPWVTDAAEQPIYTRQHRWLLKTRAEVIDFRGWLAACAGRLNPFWMPSFVDDVEPVRDLDSNAVIIDVAHSDYVMAANIDGRRDVLIAASDGRRWCRRIKSWQTATEDFERMVIDAPLGIMLKKEQTQISFMRLARLDSDAAEIAYITDEAAQVRLNVRSLKAAA